MVVRVHATVNFDSLHVDRWYDKSTRNWICTLQDADGNQVGDSIVVGNRAHAMQITKENFRNQNPTDQDNEDRYGAHVPLELRRPLGALRELIREHPGELELWDVKKRRLMFTLMSLQSSLLVSTRDLGGERGVCGLLPIVRWMKAVTCRMRLGTQEVTFKQLSKF